MPKFYFNVQLRKMVIEDEEGEEFSDLDAAKEEAVAALDELSRLRIIRWPEAIIITNDDKRELALVEHHRAHYLGD